MKAITTITALCFLASAAVAAGPEIYEATGYCTCAKCCGKWADGRCALGMQIEDGWVRRGAKLYRAIAVDPRVIPLGSVVIVEGAGVCLACDTGRLIKGKKLDICHLRHSAALRFGRKRVRVWVEKGGKR